LVRVTRSRTCQTRVLGSIATLDRGNNLLGAGHRRYCVRAHEAGGLDARQPCRGEPVDEFRAERRRERLRLVLETVAWSHVADGHAHEDG
jgi:hypothetical protein